LPEHDYAADMALLEAAVRDGGAIAKTFLTGRNKTRRKADGSPVSDADLAVDRFLKEALRPARPAYAWLSEETEDDAARLSAKRVFVVDPIDGTVAFLKGRPHFTIVAAVVEDGVPVAAAIYNPLTEESFTAAKGGGAWRNGAPIRVSGRAQLEGCRMLASRETLRNPCWGGWPEMTLETPNSIAYRFALVASGAFDAAITTSATHDWDLAAADLIVREAGGLSTSHHGTPLRFNRADIAQPSALAAGPALHAAILSRLDGPALRDLPDPEES
jgi:myo-inositol-1(or 4)-monophosphatase